LTDADDLDQLRDALRGTLGTATVDGPPAVDASWPAGWSALAELGVTGFCVPEAKGGFGFEVEAAVASAQELGAALHGAAYAGLTASAHALAHGDAPVCDEVLAGILAGERLCAFGVLDPSSTVSDGRVAGVARLVDGAADADAMVLVEPSAPDLVLVADPADWTVEPLAHTFDVSRACGDVLLDGARAHRVAGVRAARQLHGVLLAADTLGGVSRMLDRTVAYARQRHAFGRPIGGFQAVQHRLVDHAVRVRGMSLVVAEAARLLSARSPDAARHVALAELTVSAGAVHVLHDLVQLTGAIGFTWEYGLHLYERRAHHNARLAGNPRAAVRALAEIEAWAGGPDGAR
jgi:alkylation response protein AidB-like acyl-CoA dehydrogenase